MIIQGQDKQLISLVLTASDGSSFISGTLYGVILLESSDADSGKYWTTGSTWESLPLTSASFPTGSHLKAGMWSYTLSGSATASKKGASVHYTYIDSDGFLNELSSSVIVGAGEHVVYGSLPESSSQIADAIWDEPMTLHTNSAGVAGRLLSDATGSFVSADLVDAIWDEPMTLHTNSAGIAGRLLSDATGSFVSADLVDAIWDESMVLHTSSAGTAGRLLSDATGSATATVGATTIAEISASVWNAVLGTDHTGTGTAGKYITDITGSLKVYESEPA